MKTASPKHLACLLSLLSVSSLTAAQITATPEEARAIAKEAYIYGNPLVDHYRIQYAYFVDKESPEYKTTWNEMFSMARVYTPEDKAIQSPNSDTPYSFIGMDLRAEPLVITLPKIDKDRYFSLQFIDSYTYNFAFAGEGLRFGMFVHHDDAEREWAYDRQSPIGRLDKGLDEAKAKGWTVVSMKDDWKTIFPFGKE